MAALDKARRKLKSLLESFQEKRPVRVVYMGDGRGTAENNIRVPGFPDHVFVRESLGDRRFFQVLNRGKVQPMFNLPVITGYTEDEPESEQVLGLHYGGLGQGTTGTNLSNVGPHRGQHQFRGGDEIYIDSRLLLPGLVYPTSPASMSVIVGEFLYYYSSWNRFPSTTSKSLLEYLPTAPGRYVLIAFDPVSGSLVYRPGDEFALIGFGLNFAFIPAPSGDEYPLGIIVLTPSTTTVNWDATTNNLADGRLHLQPAPLSILSRLAQLESLSGNIPTLPCVGVG